MAHKSVRLNRSLYVDQDFFQFLLNSNNLIANLFLNLEFGDGINHIAPTESQDKISYLPKEKYSDIDGFDPYDKGIGRVTLKVGRFVGKFLPLQIIEEYGISKNDIERFVNIYKSWFDPSKYVIKVVEGEEIRKWYSEENYYAPNGNASGTLWNSCMRYQKRMKFLDLYCENPNIKMLVMLQDVDGEWKVRTRAILWDNVFVDKDFSGQLPDVINVMDRIYSVFDSDVDTFKKWAEQNGYIPKYEQNAKSHQFFDIKGQITRVRCRINLDKSDFRYYPYLDTFPYFNWGNHEISNDEYGFSWDYKLVQADGSLEPPPPQEDDTNDDW
jgi:hypothetical protein